MAKDNTVLIIAAVAAGAYLLRDSFKPVEKIAGNLGTATTGLGEGISSIGSAAGQIAGSVGGVGQSAGGLVSTILDESKESYKGVSDWLQGLPSQISTTLRAGNQPQMKILNPQEKLGMDPGFTEKTLRTVRDVTSLGVAGAIGKSLANQWITGQLRKEKQESKVDPKTYQPYNDNKGPTLRNARSSSKSSSSRSSKKSSSTKTTKTMKDYGKTALGAMRNLATKDSTLRSKMAKLGWL